MEKYYTIHDIVKFKIVSKGFFKWRFDNIYKSYENFEIKKNEDLDFIVFLGKFSPSNQDCQIINNNYYIKEDYFFCQNDKYKFANWEFEMSGFENGPTIINIKGNLAGYLWMVGFIIEFFIHYKMNEKGYPLVHASCISNNNRGYIFSARGGSGKTTISLNLVEMGFKLLGDNFVILHDNHIISYLSPLNIFTYNLTPIIKRKFSIRNKIILSFKDLFYKLTFKYIKIFTTLNPKKLIPESTIDKSGLNAVFIIFPKNKLKIEKIDKDILCDHLLINQKLDTLLFLEYISEYSYVFPNSKMSKHWERYRENLNINLPSDMPFYKVEVPQKYDRKVFDNILEVINETKNKL